MSEDLVISSTTDTAAQMKAALQRGLEPPKADEVLAVVDDGPAVEEEVEKPAEKEEEQPPVKTAEEKVAEEKASADEKKSRLDKRIDKLTWEREEEKRRREASDARIAELEAKLAEKPKIEEKVEKVVVKPLPKPKLDDFDTTEAYNEAVTDWKIAGMRAEVAAEAEAKAQKRVDDALAAETKKREDAEQAVELEQQQQRFNAQRVKAIERYPDFEETLEANKKMPLTGVMAQNIMTSDVSHDMTYYLWKHPEEATRLVALGETPAAIREMGRFEGLIRATIQDDEPEPEPGAEGAVETKPAVRQSAAERQAARASELPAPIKPVGGRAVTTVDESRDTSPFMDPQWKARRNKEEAERRRNRR
jgi:hypothetical protein